MTIFLSVFHFHFLPALWLCRHQNRLAFAEWTDGHGIPGQGLEDHYYEALAFSQHNIDLVFDEENMKPEKLTMEPENEGIDPSTMRVGKWYRELPREDDDPHFPSSTRVSDVVTGTGKQLFFNDNPLMWTVMLCVNYHQKQDIFLTLLRDLRNLHTAWMRPPDAGGTSLTRHCAVMAWFPASWSMLLRVVLNTVAWANLETISFYTVPWYKQHSS